MDNGEIWLNFQAVTQYDKLCLMELMLSSFLLLTVAVCLFGSQYTNLSSATISPEPSTERQFRGTADAEPSSTVALGLTMQWC